jgi:hypothetical protein
LLQYTHKVLVATVEHARSVKTEPLIDKRALFDATRSLSVDSWRYSEQLVSMRATY